MPMWRKYWLVLLVRRLPIRLCIRGLSILLLEERELSNVYAEILANLKLTPSELKKRVDYYQEREKLLTQPVRRIGRRR